MAKTDEEIKIETEAAAEATEAVETAAAEAEAKLEETVESNLRKTFGETHEPLSTLAESDSETDEPSPKKDDTSAESSDDEDGPTPAEAVEEKKIEAEEAAAKAAEEAASSEEATAGTETESKATDEEAGKAEGQGDVPQLSEAYYRAAIHMGWTDEDIKASLATNPELATKTFANIYETVNRSSKEYAQFGQAKREADAKLVEKPKPSEQATSEYKSAVDIDKLRIDNPGDPMVDMIAAQDAQNKLMFDKINAMETSAPVNTATEAGAPTAAQQRATNQEAAAIQQQVDGFFSGEEVKPYSDFYGVIPKNGDWDSLTPGEQANRWAVIDMMDQMIVGAESFGQVMEIDEAMRRAHLSVSEPLREKIIREGIMGEVEKRSNAMTLKPSSTAKSSAASAPQTPEELVAVTEKRLRATFHGA